MSESEFTVSLIRHAKSAWDLTDVADIYRPLSARGYRQLEALACSGELLNPDCVVTSPAVRAYTTARQLYDQMASDNCPFLIEPVLYESGISEVVARLTLLAPRYGHSIWLVGHNPMMDSLVEYLSDRNVSLNTCSVAVLSGKIAAGAMQLDACYRISSGR